MRLGEGGGEGGNKQEGFERWIWTVGEGGMNLPEPDIREHELGRASQVAQAVKNPPANAGDLRDAGPLPGSGRAPGGGHGDPLQCSCLEKPTDRGAWRATVHGVAKRQSQLKELSTHAMHTLIWHYSPPESGEKKVKKENMG